MYDVPYDVPGMYFFLEIFQYSMLSALCFIFLSVLIYNLRSQPSLSLSLSKSAFFVYIRLFRAPSSSVFHTLRRRKCGTPEDLTVLFLTITAFVYSASVLVQLGETLMHRAGHRHHAVQDTKIQPKQNLHRHADDHYNCDLQRA